MNNGDTVVEDRALIVEVLARYLHATDAHNGHEAAALFTPSCVLAVHVMGGRIPHARRRDHGRGNLSNTPSRISCRCHRLACQADACHRITSSRSEATRRLCAPVFCIVTSGLPEMSEDTAPNAAFARRFGQIIQSGLFPH